MVNTQFDSLWPWLRSDSQEDLPGVRAGGDAADPILAGASFGLTNWRPPDAFQRPPWLEIEAHSPSFRVGTDSADSTTGSPSYGLSNWRPPEPIHQATGGNVDASQGLSNWRPPFSAEQPSIGFRMRPDGSIDKSRTGSARPFDTRAPTFGGDPSLDTEQRPASQSWWSEISRPWLRADSGREPPALDATREAGTPEFNPLSFAAPPVALWPPSEEPASDGVVPVSDGKTPLNDLRPAAAGVMAATANAATAGGASGAQVAGEVLSKVGELAGRAVPAVAELVGRAAPAAAGATSAVAGALPLLFIPTNTQSETIDLEDGVRARVSPGQRTVEIERRVGTGLFGTGIGARWERLPVDAEMRVGKGGAATLVIDQGQLRQALNPAEDRDASNSEMARRPDKLKDGASQPPAGIGHNSGEVSDSKSSRARDPKNDKARDAENDKAPDPKNKAPDPRNNKPPSPNNGNGPSIWDHVLASTFEILKSGKQAKSVDEERIDTCRKVMKGIGQPAPDGQYRGPDGRDTAAGVRLGPDMRDPAAGLDHYPEQQHLRDGVRGEQELANRIRQFNPKEKIIHFGPAAGTHGPDVMSISEKGEVAFWDSKFRNRAQSIPPSRRANPTDKSLFNLKETEEHIKNAVADGTLSKEAAAKAVANLITRNFLLCTVGMGQAHQGVVEIVRDGQRTGPL